jgi:hypothetical protein
MRPRTPSTSDSLGFGSWLDDSAYGRVWQPAPECVGAGFVPYASAGRWSLDDGKLRWKSSAPWGDTTFHRGNWVWLPERRWAWAPPTPTSPPALAWRLGANHVGWAPVPPSRIAASPQPPSGESTRPFRFVKVGDLLDEDVSRHLVTELGEGRALLAAAPRLDGTPEAKSLLTAATVAPVAAMAPTTRTTTATAETRRLAPTPSKSGSRYQCKQVTETPRTWRCAWE